MGGRLSAPGQVTTCPYDLMKNDLKKFLEKSIKEGIFPSAELLVASSGKIKTHISAGDIANSPEKYFDLASLTKPLATAILFMIAFDKGKIKPKQTLSHFFPKTHLKDITITQLLNHTSGLIDWYDFATPLLKKKKGNYQKNQQSILNSILTDKKFQTHQNKTLYSDLGYIILGAVLEKIEKQSLDNLFKKQISKPLKIEKEIFFSPLHKRTTNDEQRTTTFVPSEVCLKRDKIMQGEVMDENAFVMGGVSGHAGLFGTSTGIHKILLELRRAKMGKSNLVSQKSFEMFCTPNTKRAWSQRVFTLGFDTPTKPGSQSGKYFSKSSIGHLGYSGTSFWWDLEKDLWIILLTNRCMPSRENKKISVFRPQLHDLIFEKLI